MITEDFKNQIRILRDKYINMHAYIPEPIITYTFNDKHWAKFKIEELYAEEYILYINPILENQSDELIEQVIFHEFTHLADSLELKNYDIKTFKCLMNIYSETHASEILMDTLLQTQTKPYSLNKEVIYNVRLTLSSFMYQTLNNLEKSFMFKGVLDVTQNMNYKKFYYFIGYLISLKKNGIYFSYQFKSIDQNLSKLFNKIIKSFLDNDYNNELLIQYENDMVSLILENTKKMLNLPTITCPYCQSTKTMQISNVNHSTSFSLFKFGSKVSQKWHCNDCNADF